MQPPGPEGRNISRHRRETRASYGAARTGDSLMLAFQLIGAAFLLLCLAPLVARDPRHSRLSR